MKKYAYLVISLLLVFAAMRAGIGVVIDEDAIAGNIVSELERVIDRDITIGGVGLEIFPAPVITISGFSIDDPDSVSGGNILEAKNITITVGWSALFSDDMQFSAISVYRPRLNLERSRSGVLNLKTFMSGIKQRQKLPQALLSMQEGFSVAEGNIRYVDYLSDEERTFNDIYAIVKASDHEAMLEGEVEIWGRKFFAEIKLPDVGALIKQSDMRDGGKAVKLPFSMTVKDKDSSLELNGRLITSGGGPGYDGEISFASSNALNSLALLKGEEFYRIQVEKSAVPMDMSLKAKLRILGNKAVLRNIIVDGEFIEGKADASVSYDDDKTDVILKAELDKADIDRMYAAGVTGFAMSYPKNTDQPITFSQTIDKNTGKVRYHMPESLTLKTALKIGNVTAWKQRFADTTAFVEVKNGVVVIRKLKSSGRDGELLLFDGFLKEGGSGAELEGQIKLAGKNLSRHMQNLFTKAGANITISETEYGAFRGRANLFLSSKVLRLSELQILVGDKEIRGALLHHPGEENKTEAVMKISNLDFDSLFNVNSGQVEAKTEVEAKAEAGEEKGNKGIYEALLDSGKNILMSLNGKYLFRLDFENYKLNGRFHEKSVMKGRLSKGKVVFDGLDIVYGDSHFKGGMELDLQQDIPKLDINIEVDEFVLENIIGNDGRDDVQNSESDGELWSRRRLDTGWISGYEGDFAIKVAKLKYGARSVKDLVLKGKMEPRMIKISLLRGGIWGGRLEGSGNLLTGQYPGMNMEFSLSNVSLLSLSEVIPLLGDVSGRISVTGSLSTTGVSMFSWVTNADGIFAIAGRNVLVKGINVSGIVRAVNVVRKVSDIVYAVEQAYAGGNTIILKADGKLSLSGGKLTTNDIRLKTEFGGGNVSGYVDIHKLIMDMAVTLRLDVLDRRDPPSFTVTYEGKVENPRQRLDTNYLEAFVAKKAAEKLVK